MTFFVKFVKNIFTRNVVEKQRFPPLFLNHISSTDNGMNIQACGLNIHSPI